MKKIVSVILCALVLAPCFGGFSTQAREPLKFLVLGDSIARGYGNFPGDEYASLVAQEMGFDLINYAWDGAKSTDLLNGLKNDIQMREAVGGADIIEISIGGNDILFSDAALALVLEALFGGYATAESILAGTKRNLIAIIAEIHLLNEDCVLIIQNIYDAGPVIGLPFSATYWSGLVRRGNAVFSECHAAEPSAFYLADIHSAANWKSGLMISDNVHPNRAGHEVIAEVLLELLRTIKLYPDPPEIVTGSLPDGTVGTAYSQALEAAGEDVITWSLAEGALPEGLALSPEGVISGILAETGVFSFTVKAENGGGEDTKGFSIEVKGLPCAAKYVGFFGMYTKYEATPCNWFMFILLFGWLWMR